MDVLIFLLVLSILVLIHEFGHYIAARLSGVYVEEFGIGLPPRLISRKIGETVYSVNLLPFGGFVKLHGEEFSENLKHPARAFSRKSKIARMLIIIAGVFMNFILAIVCFSVVYSVSGIPRETANVKVLDVVEGSPAQINGILVGDIVRRVDGKLVVSTKEFIDMVEAKKGKRVKLEIERSNALGLIGVAIALRESPPQGQGPLGVLISSTEIYFPPWHLRPFIGSWLGFKDALTWGGTVILGFGKLFSDIFGGTIPKDLAGPVGIFALTTEASRFGPMAIVNFLGILSINLAVLNILPFPALDGGRLFFVLIEAVLGRRVVPKLESVVHTVGMVILLALIFAITAHDVQRLIRAGSIAGFIDSILK